LLSGPVQSTLGLAQLMSLSCVEASPQAIPLLFEIGPKLFEACHIHLMIGIEIEVEVGKCDFIGK
jgi:hypothetical protein